MNYFPVRCLDTYKFMIWQITAKIMTEQQLTEIKVLNSDFKTLQIQIKHSYLLLTFKFLLENSCYENMEGHHQGCLFPDISLILTALIFIWLHCLTSMSPGSPQKPSSGTAVIPDVADTDMWNNTSLCEHECCVPLIKLLQQPTCKCSSLADVVRLWKNTFCL